MMFQAQSIHRSLKRKGQSTIHIPLVQAFMMLDNYFLFLPEAVII